MSVEKDTVKKFDELKTPEWFDFRSFQFFKLFYGIFFNWHEVAGNVTQDNVPQESALLWCWFLGLKKNKVLHKRFNLVSCFVLEI